MTALPRPRPFIGILARVVVLGLLAVACGGGGDGPAPDEAAPAVEGEIRVAAAEDVWPLWGPGPRSKTFAAPLNVNVFEPLVYMEPDDTLRPALAERWELVDGGTWRFHLRRDVQFHDGTPFGADDVVWSWTERQPMPRLPATTLGPGSVRKVDDHTVDFVPAVPNLRFPEQVTSTNAPIVPRGRHTDSTPPAGTGPFSVVEYRPRQRAVLQRFDGYWGEKAGVSRLTFRFHPDVETRVEALERGDVDLALEIPPEAVARVEAIDGVGVVRSRDAIEHLLLLNRSGQGPAREPAVRQAVSLALDPAAYVAAGLAGNGRPSAPRHDPAEAGRVLDAAGWRPGPDGVRERDGAPLHLVLIGGLQVPDAALSAIRSQLGQVGVRISVKHARDRLTYDEYRLEQFDLDLHLFTAVGASGLSVPAAVGYSEIPEAKPFAPGEAFDAEVRRALAAPTPEEARATSVELMRILVDQERVVVPLAGLPQVHAVRGNVKLADPHPSLGQQMWTGLTRSG
ncbi:MAG: ABC transporter substrate-binding protein [Actinomycetota bacterium]|nr:ABC transporter substrate-binding protein [Actinomycetota bacterium]